MGDNHRKPPKMPRVSGSRTALKGDGRTNFKIRLVGTVAVLSATLECQTKLKAGHCCKCVFVRDTKHDCRSNLPATSRCVWEESSKLLNHCKENCLIHRPVLERNAHHSISAFPKLQRFCDAEEGRILQRTGHDPKFRKNSPGVKGHSRSTWSVPGHIRK